MEEFLNNLIDLGTSLGGKIVLALIVFIVGLILIRFIKKLLVKMQNKSKLDKTVQGFIKNLVVIILDILLAMIVIEILGIPMTSVLAVLASCGLAIGLALQGALSNFAGGIMILVFKPFKVGDYISATGDEGIVKEISVFYTHLVTLDNKHITIPNGDLMNNNVTNFSCEDFRRVDLDFKITNDIDEEFVKDVLLKAAENTKGVLSDPPAFARLSAVDDDTYIFTVRAWCESPKYWDVYFDLIENCSKDLSTNGIDDPEERIAVRLVNESKENQ